MKYGKQWNSLFSLRDRTIELEMIPACKEFGIGLIPWSPLAGGLLGGIIERNADLTQKSLTKHYSQVEDYEKLCKSLGESPANVALAWLLNNPVVTAPIIGPRTMEQMVDSKQSLNIELTDEVLQRLDEIWPGPGGQAPEAYAW